MVHMGHRPWGFAFLPRDDRHTEQSFFCNSAWIPEARARPKYAADERCSALSTGWIGSASKLLTELAVRSRAEIFTAKVAGAAGLSRAQGVQRGASQLMNQEACWRPVFPRSPLHALRNKDILP